MIDDKHYTFAQLIIYQFGHEMLDGKGTFVGKNKSYFLMYVYLNHDLKHGRYHSMWSETRPCNMNSYYIVVMMYILDLYSLSTIAWNVTHMDSIMKMILKVGFHHTIEMIWGLIVVSSTILSFIILKHQKVVVKYSGIIKICNLVANRLSNTFDVSRKIVLCAYPLGLLIMTRF